MTDRENVMKGLECCVNDKPFYHAHCDECPYNGRNPDNLGGCTQLYRDALELLKEQEPVKPKSRVRHGAYGQIQHFCGNCNALLYGKQKYCSKCGKEIKWG